MDVLERDVVPKSILLACGAERMCTCWQGVEQMHGVDITSVRTRTL